MLENEIFGDPFEKTSLATLYLFFNLALFADSFAHPLNVINLQTLYD
jgi:hypothetical protein